MRGQRGGQRAAGVDHQQIARPQQIRKVSEGVMGKGIGAAVGDQQPDVVARQSARLGRD